MNAEKIQKRGSEQLEGWPFRAVSTLQDGLFKITETLSAGDEKNGAANTRAREEQPSLWTEFTITFLAGLSLKPALCKLQTNQLWPCFLSTLLSSYYPASPWTLARKFLTHPLFLLHSLRALSYLFTRMLLLALLIAQFLPVA